MAVFCLFGGLMKKITFHSEIAYLIGLMLTAIGNALVSRADFGMSMVVAPSYILHVKISEWLPFYSFGMSGYIFQGMLVILTAIIVRRFRLSYLFSFVTAVIFGIFLDIALIPASLIPSDTLTARIILMAVGLAIVPAGVSLLFNTYISPEAYELLVKEVSKKYTLSPGLMKTVYDVSSLILALILSAVFFGFDNLVGIGVATVIAAILNGPLISLYIKMYNRLFEFKDIFSFRNKFE